MALTRRQNAPGYHATMGGIRSSIVAGGRTIAQDKFIPAINASFHDDEAWLDLNHIDTAQGNIADVVETDGKIKFGQHEFAPVDDSNLKWDVVYTNAVSVPSTIRFRIRHSSNLSFFRQVLTQEDIDNGASYRVPEAHNSFAVYFNNGRRDNKYQTGKVAHIYSMYFVDEAGAESPLIPMDITPDIDNAKMLVLDVTAVLAWLNDPARVGKITLDPTIGLDTLGALSTYFSGITVALTAVQASDSGTAQFVKFWSGTSTGGYGAYALVETDGIGPTYYSTGQNLVAYGASTLVTAASTIHSSAATAGSAGGTITAGNYYRIVCSTDGPNGSIAYDVGASASKERINKAYDGLFADPLSVPIKFNATYIMSAWVEYGSAAIFNRSRIVNTGSTGPQNRSTIANA